MPTLTCTLSFSYGDVPPPATNVPLRTAKIIEIPYTEESVKRVRVPASSTDFPIALDSVGAPKFLFVGAVDIDATVKLSDQTDDVGTALSAGSGFVCITNPSGQPINQLLVTTAATPTTGALIEILAFE